MSKEESPQNVIVHLETRIVTTFGVLDEDGNVKPLLVQANPRERDDPLVITKFSKEAFEQAFQALEKVREQLKCQPLQQ